MKKRTILLLSLLGLTIILEACNLVSDAKEGKKQQSQAPVTTQTQINQETLPSGSHAAVSSESYIGETRALEIALEHAGINSSELLFSKSYFEYDDRRAIYDVEFYAGIKEYDYEIDAVTGNILGFDSDMEYDFIPPAAAEPKPAVNQSGAPTPASSQPVQQQPSQAEPTPQPASEPIPEPTPQPTPEPTPQQSSGNLVSLEDAKQIALNKVPGATADHIRIKQDRDDGRTVYEGKIIYNQMEYEFEIDAATGNIIDWDAESIYD